MIPSPIIKTPLEANLLEKFIVTGDYAFKWQGRMVTMPRADKALELYYRKPIKSKVMNLQQAKEAAITSTKKNKGKLYINVDEGGNCSTSKTFAIESSVFCYQNGSQIALTSNLKIGDQNENLNTMEKSTGKKVTAKKAAKPAKKEAPAKKVAAKAEDRKPLPKGVKELTGAEIIKLLKAGKEVVTPGAGNPFTESYLKKGDLSHVRKCVVN